MTGLNAYNNSYTASSAQAFAALAGTDPLTAATLLRKSNVGYVKPETVRAIELGYRGQFKGFSFDINTYYNTYNNFLGNLTVVAPYYGAAVDSPNPLGNPLTDLGTQSLHALANGNTRNYQLYTNTDIEIKSLGFGVGVSKKYTKILKLVPIITMLNSILIKQKIQVLKLVLIRQNTELKLLLETKNYLKTLVSM